MKLEAREIKVKFNNKTVLDGISFSVEEGIYALVGPNSSGKSTLLKALAGLVKPTSGKVLIGGEEVQKLEPRERAKIVGYCWQNPYYGFFEDSVSREIEFVLKNTGLKGNKEILEILAVEKLMDRQPFKLSGGEARRVSIASVVVADQPVVLLDEPFNDLDLDGYISILNLLKYFKKREKTVIVALNNGAHLGLYSFDAILLLYNGKLIGQFKPEEVSDEILEKYNIVTRKMLIESLT